MRDGMAESLSASGFLACYLSQWGNRVGLSGQTVMQFLMYTSHYGFHVRITSQTNTSTLEQATIGFNDTDVIWKCGI